MPIEARFALAILILAAVAFGCRVFGLLIGARLSENANLKRIFDILPACAIGAVLGPSLGSMSALEGVAVAVSAAFYLASARFVLALSLGVAVLLSERWLDLPGF